MHRKKLIGLVGLLILSLMLASGSVFAAKKNGKKSEGAPLSGTGDGLHSKYSALLDSLESEITRALPAVAEQKKSALEKARAATRAAEAKAEAAKQPLNKISGAQGLVDHAKGKWIGSAKKGVAEAEAALKKASSPAEREAAKADLARWQANLDEGNKALKERQAALDKAKAEAANAPQAHQAAQAALAQARSNELAAAKAVLAAVEPFVVNANIDAKLVKAAVLAYATPRGLAEFGQQGREQEMLVAKLLADDALMKEMLIAGGAKYNKFGRAMELFAAIQKTSPKSGEGALRRLALAVALEHATPVKQSNASDQADGPNTVDPVKRYLHYEKAYLAGELDPAFKDLTTWEMRMVVDCDAPDEILAWGREMLRTYRPDHITNPNYGWRYVSSVKTDVRYGSQDVGNDLSSLHQYQNIPMNGGVCGRRAFFGRFILQSFGIPVWGVTQHRHAALSHWTPKGWVVNLGAGFNASWWDKDEVPRSGSDFLLETQAREDLPGFMKVLRAQWVSRILDETAYNDRKNIAGGFWSGVGHYQTVVIAAKAVELGPLGQELGEANAPDEDGPTERKTTMPATPRTAASQVGTITIPSVDHKNSSGRSAEMKSFTGGMQIHAGGGFKAEYVIDAPMPGKYALVVRVATLQTGQTFLITVNEGKETVEVEVPHTVGLWQQTKPVVLALNRGQNVLDFAIRDGSRGVAIKEFILTPVK